MIKKISNEVLVERIDTLRGEVSELKDQLKNTGMELRTTSIEISAKLENLKNNFPTREDLQDSETRLRTPLEKVTNTVYGPDGTDGLVTKAQSNADSIQTLYKIIAIYVSVNTSILGFIIWIIFTKK